MGNALPKRTTSRLFRYLTPLVLAVGLLAPPAALAAADAYTQGVTAYKQKRYEQAYAAMASAHRENPADPKRIFYLGLICTQTNRLNDAREYFDHVLKMLPDDDPLAAKARNNLLYVTNAQMVKVGNAGKANLVISKTLQSGGQGNYLAYVLDKGRVIRFDERRMPLRVYVGDGRSVPGWTPAHRGAMTAAMNAWQRATANRVRFVATTNPAQADIVVRWQKNFSDSMLGVSPYVVSGSTLVRSDVALAVYYPDSTVPIPMGELQAVATHELGHAIGIKGHSPYTGDMMYYARDHRQSGSLSSRDVSTIKLLYQVEADVKNDASRPLAESYDQQRRYQAHFERALAAQKTGDSQQAMSAYREAIGQNPQGVEAPFNLAGLLVNQGSRLANTGNLQVADSYFNEAVTLYQGLLNSGNLSDSQIPAQNVAQNLAVARENLSRVRGLRQQRSSR